VSQPRINSKLLAAEHEGCRVVQSTVLRKAEHTAEVQRQQYHDLCNVDVVRPEPLRPEPY
jgi:hypothetical protein